MNVMNVLKEIGIVALVSITTGTVVSGIVFIINIIRTKKITGEDAQSATVFLIIVAVVTAIGIAMLNLMKSINLF